MPRIGKKRRRAVAESRKQRHQRAKGRRRFAKATVGKLVIVVVALALCAVFPVFVNSAFGYVPLLLAVLLIVADFVYMQLLAHFVTWRQEALVGDCPRGEDVLFRVRLRNGSPLFCFHARAYFYISDMFGGAAKSYPTNVVLGPLSSQDHDIKVRFEHLGTYSAGVDRVEFSGIVGLFTKTVRGQDVAQVQVTPTIHPIENLGFSTTAPSDSRVALKTVADDSLNYAGVREYRRGDPLKRVHWGLSAKGNRQLLTKMFETPTNPGVCIIMDFTAPQGLTVEELSTLFDVVVESAFSIDAYARSAGMESELQFTDRYGETETKHAWSHDDMVGMVEDMPRMQPGESTMATEELLLNEAQSLYGQSNIVLCTANPSAELVNAMLGVKIARRNPLFVLAAPVGQDRRERKRWCSPLERLDAAGIGYVTLDDTELIGRVNEE